MTPVLYQTRSDEGCGAFSENQDKLTITFDNISGKGDSYDFRGVIRRLGDQRWWKRQKRNRCGRRMSRGKWHRSCPKRRTAVEVPFETDGGKDG